MAWYWWVLAALALAGAELLLGQLVLLMLSAGAVAGALASATGAPLLWQVIVAAVVSLLMLVFVRPVAVRHMQTTDRVLRTGIDLLKGAKGVVLEQVNGQDGRIKLNGEVWSARTYDPYVTIEPGGSVVVVEIDGATAVVLPTEP